MFRCGRNKWQKKSNDYEVQENEVVSACGLWLVACSWLDLQTTNLWFLLDYSPVVFCYLERNFKEIEA